MLVLCRDLIALRRSAPDLVAGDYEARPAPDGLWAYRRGARFVVVLNLSDGAGSLDIGGRIRLSSNRVRDGEAVSGRLEVGAWEAVVVETG